MRTGRSDFGSRIDGWGGSAREGRRAEGIICPVHKEFSAHDAVIGVIVGDSHLVFGFEIAIGPKALRKI